MSGIFDQIINYSPPLLAAGQVNYDGTWNAATNTPALVNPPDALSKGDYYVVSAAGTQFGISFAVGDWIISNGTAWEKVDLTDAVSSVFGRTGAVVGVSTDYSAVGLTNTAVGAANPSTGAFTTLSSSSTTTLNGTTVPASKTLVVTTDKLSALAATTSAELAGVISDETGSGALVFATSPTLVTPALGTPSALVGTNITGTASGLTAGNVTTNANLTGEVTSVGNAATLTNSAVIGKVLTGYTSGAGTVAATDSILQAIQKLNGNDATNANLTGAITSVGNATSLGSFTSANLATALTDETGSGANVFATSPTLVTPILGTPQSGTLTSCTGLPLTTGVTGILPAANGGTGVANSSTITLAGNLTHAGAFTQSFTATANTALTLPTTGTLATLAGSEGLSNKTITLSSFSGTTGAFSGQVTSTVTTGTAPFVVASTTNIPNLNASSLNGATFAAPGAIGGTTPSTGAFTTLSASGLVSFNATGTNTVGPITGSTIWRVRGGNTNTSDGSAVYIDNATTVIGGYGNKSQILGGAYSATALLYNLNNLEVTAGGTSTVATFTSTGLGIGVTNPQQQLAIGGTDDQVGAGVSGTVSTLYFGNPSNLTGGISRLAYNRSTGILTFTGGTIAAPVTTMTVNSVNGVAVSGALSSTGNFIAGTSSGVGGRVEANGGSGQNGLGAYTPTAANSCVAAWNAATSGDNVFVSFFTETSITARGTIDYNRAGNLVRYNTTSDKNLKTNIRDLTNSGLLIDRLQPRIFDWKAEGHNTDNAGFIAQEVVEVFPDAVSKGSDTFSESSDYKQWAMDAGKFMPLVIAELKSLRARVAALES